MRLERHGLPLLLFLSWLCPADTGSGHNFVTKTVPLTGLSVERFIRAANQRGRGYSVDVPCWTRDSREEREFDLARRKGLNSCGDVQRLRGGKGRAKRQREDTSNDSQEIALLGEETAISSDDAGSYEGLRESSSTISEGKQYEAKFANDSSWSTPNSLSFHQSSQWFVGNSSEFSAWQTCDEAKPSLSVRDVRKWTKHLRAMNGGGKPVPCEEGFDCLPDVLVVGGSEGEDRDSALVQSFSFGASRSASLSAGSAAANGCAASRRGRQADIDGCFAAIGGRRWRTEMAMGFARDGCASLVRRCTPSV